MAREPQELYKLFEMLEKTGNTYNPKLLHPLRLSLDLVSCENSCAVLEGSVNSAMELEDPTDGAFCPHRSLQKYPQ